MLLIALSCTFAGVLGGYFLTSYQVTQSAKHACTSLSILTAHPVPNPSDPAANPSRETNYKLYLGFLNWKESVC